MTINKAAQFNKEITPSEYFNLVKDKKNQIDDAELVRIYDNCLVLLNKYEKTGQIDGMKKLIFHLETIEKEREIIRLGVDTFVYRDDIEEFIDTVTNDVVKLIELERYQREIPDEVVSKLEKVRDKFDQFYVVFTDYTGKIERKIEKKRREKDPILFGTFQDKQSDTVIDRFYFIGDWIDEHCDLTLDKMVNEMRQQLNKEIKRAIDTPKDIKKLKKQLSRVELQQDRFVLSAQKPKSSVVDKMKRMIGKG